MNHKSLALLLVFVLCLSGCQKESPQASHSRTWMEGGKTMDFAPEDRTEVSAVKPTKEPGKKVIPEDYMLKIHFLDVGQANATLIQFREYLFLVDGGNYADTRDIMKYIDSLGDKFTFYKVFATHQHEDHIGGLSKIITKYDPYTVYAPPTPENLMNGLKTYQYFREAVDANQIYFCNPSSEETIYEDDDYNFRIETVYGAEDMHSDDINSYSLMIKVTFRNRSFLLTGDATEETENAVVTQEMERENKLLPSDVLLVAHHGSSASTTDSFLSLVNPKYAIISCEKGNEYGHPHTEVLNRLGDRDIYRTDTDGTVIASTNGDDIKFYKKCTGNFPMGSQEYDGTIKLPDECFTDFTSLDDDEEEINEGKLKCKYICDSTTGLYHTEDCEHLVQNKSLWIEPVDMNELKATGYKPCEECIPYS